MKTKLTIIITVLCLWGITTVYSQGFQPPASGKSVVYFVSLKKKSNVFEYFHQDKYIGVFGKYNYMRYEVETGKQLLWASSESKEFLTMDVPEGGTYIIMVTTVSGFWRTNPKFSVITPGSEDFALAKALINAQAPIVTPESKIKEMNSKLTEFTANILNLYETEWKLKYPYTTLTTEMAIPAEAMK
jgi:hypothetical protein